MRRARNKQAPKTAVQLPMAYLSLHFVRRSWKGHGKYLEYGMPQARDQAAARTK